MDNGLIFPYPCERAHDESSVLTVQKVPFSLRGIGDWMHGTFGGSSQAMG